jgi:hypothetical protein
MKYEEFRIIGLFCLNQVDYNMFKRFLNEMITDGNGEVAESYVTEKWMDFRNRPLEFLIGYDKKLFDLIKNEIEIRNYKG